MFRSVAVQSVWWLERIQLFGIGKMCRANCISKKIKIMTIFVWFIFKSSGLKVEWPLLVYNSKILVVQKNTSQINLLYFMTPGFIILTIFRHILFIFALFELSKLLVATSIIFRGIPCIGDIRAVKHSILNFVLFSNSLLFLVTRKLILFLSTYAYKLYCAG